MAAPLRFDAALVPSEITAERARGRAAVVVDVLRFSTVLVRSFEQGARSGQVVAELDDATELVARGEADVACGERGGVRPTGFHLGNSPLEFCASAVSGRRLVFTTTNGTRTVLACSSAAKLLVGCFRNRDRVAGMLDRLGLPVLVACAGTEGRLALEDVLAAGALAERLAQKRALDLTDGASAALSVWRSVSRDLRSALRSTDHGRALATLGFGPDVDFAAEFLPAAPVPVLDPASGLLVAAAPA